MTKSNIMQSEKNQPKRNLNRKGDGLVLFFERFLGANKNKQYISGDETGFIFALIILFFLVYVFWFLFAIAISVGILVFIYKNSSVKTKILVSLIFLLCILI